MPIELEATAPRAAKARERGRGATPDAPRLSAKERMFLTERLELLLETGVPLHAGLAALEAQADTPEARGLLADLREGVAGGLSFSRALAQHPEAFPPAYVHLVAAGEQGGFLPRVLERLREMDEKREELRSTLVSAFSYPAFLCVFSVAVVVFVLVMVFPKFAEIFEMIRDQLPWTTRFFMATSDVLRQRWTVWLPAGAAALFLGARWARSPMGVATLDALAFRLPGLRDITIQYQLVQFLYVMSLSLTNGVPILDALRACHSIVGSAGFRRFIEDLESRVSQGQGLASGFEQAEFLPALVPQMISTGEQSGGLALVMGRIAGFYEREWRRRLATLARVIEPLLLLVMGVVVGLIVSSLLLPIFKLSRAVH
jgi:type II secretory pathway component PulF